MESFRFRLLGILSAIFVAILPFITSRQLFFGAVNSKYLYTAGFIALAALITLWAVIFHKPQIIFHRRWLLLSLGLVLVVQYLSAVWGVFPLRSLWSDIIRSSGVFFLTGISFLAVLLSQFLNVHDWQLVRRSVAISAAIFSFLTILGVEGLGLSGRIFSAINLDIPGLTFGNTTFAGAYLVLTLIITLIEVVRAEAGSKWRKILIGLALVQIASPLLISFSLSGLGLGSARASSATALALVFYLVGYVLLKRFANYPKIWNGLWLIGLVSAIALLFTPNSFVQKKYIEESSAARIVVWESGLKSFADRPVLGWGPENFRLAFESNFDNRLYQDEYLGEVWFDRAHNVIVDTLVSVGVVGTGSIILLGGLFISVIFRARKRGLLGEAEAVLLTVIPFAHFLQLQTSFDTVATYVLGGIILGYALWLEKEMQTTPSNSRSNFIVVPVLIAIFVGSIYFLITEYHRQNSLYRTFITTNNQKQIDLAGEALSRPDMEALRLSSASMIKGLLIQIANDKGSNPNLSQIGLKQLDAYETHYKTYLLTQPDDYRIRMNYAHLLIIKTVLGDNRLKDAQAIIRDSYRLSPSNPLTYALDAITELYSGKVAKAKEKIKEGIALNPEIEFSREVLAYIEKQEKEFPVITVIKLENL